MQELDSVVEPHAVARPGNALGHARPEAHAGRARLEGLAEFGHRPVDVGRAGAGQVRIDGVVEVASSSVSIMSACFMFVMTRLSLSVEAAKSDAL